MNSASAQNELFRQRANRAFEEMNDIQIARLEIWKAQIARDEKDVFLPNGKFLLIRFPNNLYFNHIYIQTLFFIWFAGNVSIRWLIFCNIGIGSIW